MNLYAYCLSDCLSADMLEDVKGVEDCKPRLLQCGDLSVAVSDFEGERVTIERENIFAHERVIRRVLRRVTPLPFRFGTLTTTAKLGAYVEANREALIQSLGRVRDSLEMSVKIIWRAEDVRRRVLKAGEEDTGKALLGKGAAYLAEKRREILGDELLKERAEELAGWLTERVGDSASEQAVEVRPAESLVVRAAYLVGRARLSEYQKSLEMARAERPHLRFLTSGPWPPYSFSNIKP